MYIDILLLIGIVMWLLIFITGLKTENKKLFRTIYLANKNTGFVKKLKKIEDWKEFEKYSYYMQAIDIALRLGKNNIKHLENREPNLFRDISKNHSFNTKLKIKNYIVNKFEDSGKTNDKLNRHKFAIDLYKNDSKIKNYFTDIDDIADIIEENLMNK